MRVSKYLYLLVLAIALGVSFIFGPVSAGEHPWAEDPLETPCDTTGSSLSNSDSGNSGANLGEGLLGSDLYWLGVILDGTTDAVTDPNSTDTDQK